MDDDNRRTAERHAVYMGAEIELDGDRVASAVTRDASTTGLLLLARTRLEPGQTVRIRIYLPGDGDPRIVTGKVVRREPLNEHENSLWREKVAVALDTPAPDVESTLADLAAKQEKVYGSQRPSQRPPSKPPSQRPPKE